MTLFTLDNWVHLTADAISVLVSACQCCYLKPGSIFPLWITLRNKNKTNHIILILLRSKSTDFSWSQQPYYAIMISHYKIFDEYLVHCSSYCRVMPVVLACRQSVGWYRHKGLISINCYFVSLLLCNSSYCINSLL